MEHVARLHVIRYIVNPVAVREAKEYFMQGPDLDAESSHGLLLVDVETRYGLHQAVGHHKQRSFVHVSDERQREELMTELAEKTALRICEYRSGSVADEEE